MASLIRPAVVEIWTIAKNTLGLTPAVNKQYRSPKASRIDWRLLIQNQESGKIPGLTPPFTVIDVGRHQECRDYSIDLAAWKYPITFYLVDKLANEKLEQLEAQVELLRDALMPGQVFSAFSVLDLPEVDSTPGNPANQVFLQGNYPLLAVALNLRILVAETYPGQVLP